MDDTIYRQAAIDATNRTDYRGLTVEDVKKVTDEVVKELEALPSAQPEIIRCRECTRYEKANGYHPDRCNLVEGLNIITKDSFCSWAERRSDE